MRSSYEQVPEVIPIGKRPNINSLLLKDFATIRLYFFYTRADIFYIIFSEFESCE
jgi:hypothetical protein